MTREDFHEQGVLIKRDGLSLYGLLRTPPGSRRLAVLVPWGYGDRTGMTRIYVEAARRLYRAGVASLCIDTPPNNYSRDSQARGEALLAQARYIEHFISHMACERPDCEISILGYCSSAISALYVARKHGLPRVVALNPWDFQFYEFTEPAHVVFFDYSKYYANSLEIHYLIAEREEASERKAEYLRRFFEDDRCRVTRTVISDTDHLFSGWRNKHRLADAITTALAAA
jgi:hypothetical protein